MTTEKNHALEQAQAQASAIVRMVAALECDYDRLEELRGNKEENERIAAAYAERMYDWQANADATDELSELAELEEAANGCADQEEAQQAIQEVPLSVDVRSDWQSAGETLTASEFRILLCTGGPAVQIAGELDEHLQPCRAWIEYQDWGTPWTRLVDCPASQDTLLTYCQQFVYGDV